MNGNEICELSSVPRFLNTNLRSLLISNNDLGDLNEVKSLYFNIFHFSIYKLLSKYFEVSYLVNFENLEILSIDNNPCTSYLNGAN